MKSTQIQRKLFKNEYRLNYKKNQNGKVLDIYECFST